MGQHLSKITKKSNTVPNTPTTTTSATTTTTPPTPPPFKGKSKGKGKGKGKAKVVDQTREHFEQVLEHDAKKTPQIDMQVYHQLNEIQSQRYKTFRYTTDSCVCIKDPPQSMPTMYFTDQDILWSHFDALPLPTFYNPHLYKRQVPRDVDPSTIASSSNTITQ